MSYLNDFPTDVDNAAYLGMQGSGPGTSYQVPIAAPNIAGDGTTLDGAQSHPRRSTRKPISDSTRTKQGPQSQPSPKKQKLSNMRNLAPAHPAQQTGPSKPARVTTTPAARKDPKKSKLALKKERLGDKMGTDYRLRGPTTVEQNILYCLIGNEWKRAGYHSQFREELLIKDAQQPGAPPFEKGTSVDRTSYSPITRGWTMDPRSMRDSKGRQAMLLPERPPDSQHNPKCGYLMHEGLVLLNHNNWPIKAYPGAPLTLGSSISESPNYLLVGLSRYFGMTFNDMSSRMPPVTYTRSGKRRYPNDNKLSVRAQRFTNSEANKELGMVPWFDRDKSEEAKKRMIAQRGLQDDERNAREPSSELVDTPDPYEDQDTSDNLNNLFSSTPETSVTMTTPNDLMHAGIATSPIEDGISQHQPWAIGQPLAAPEPYQFPAANEISTIPGDFNFFDQLSAMDGEQSSGGNLYDAPAFRETNFPLQTTNEVGPENIYSPEYPFEPVQQNIYSPNRDIYSPGDPFGYAQTNHYNNYIDGEFWTRENFSPSSLGF